MQEIMWWVRNSTEEAQYADKFCTHVIAGPPHPGVKSIGAGNPNYVQKYYYDVWTRYWWLLKNIRSAFVLLHHHWPVYAAKEYWKRTDPTSLEFWQRVARKQAKMLTRALRDRSDVTTINDWEIYGDAKDKYGYRELDPIETMKLVAQAEWETDIGFPYTDYRELYSLGTRFTGDRMMGTHYSPHYGPAKEGSDIVQIIVVPGGHPNPGRRYTVTQAVEQFKDGKNYMIFPNGDTIAVAKELMDAVGKDFKDPLKPDPTDPIKIDPDVKNPDEFDDTLASVV